MKLFIGLGNPGTKFKNNRHNVGHMASDASNRIKILKSNVYMNDSGRFVLSEVNKTKVSLSDLYIIHDDLDIRLGSYKIQFGKGPKVHNGLNDIYEKLKSKDFWHVRVGVDNRDSENRTKGEDYVLEDFKSEEKIILDKVIKEICKKLAAL